MKVTPLTGSGYIYTSTDSGVTWTEQTSDGIRNRRSVAISADGSKMFAAVANGLIYVSNDAGVTWTEQTDPGSNNWYSIASSADGNKLAAAANYGHIYLASTEGSATTTQPLSSKPSLNPSTGQPSTTESAPVVRQATVSITSDTCYTFEDASIASLTPDGLASPDSDVDLLGGITYNLDCTTPGGSATAEIVLGEYFSDLTKLRIYKTASTDSLELIDVTDQVTLQNRNIAGEPKTVLSYTLTDGNGFDEDHIINGKIVDPIYIGLLAASTTPMSSDEASGAGELASTGVALTIILIGAMLAAGLGGVVLTYAYLRSSIKQ